MPQAPAVARRPVAAPKPAARATPPASRAAKEEDREENSNTQGGVMTVTATISKEAGGDRAKFAGKSATATYDFGANLDEAVEKFTENVVFGVFIDQAVIRLQALLRRAIEDELTQKEIDEKVAAWQMTVGGRERKSAAEKVNDLLGKMTDEQRKALLASLRGGK